MSHLPNRLILENSLMNKDQLLRGEIRELLSNTLTLAAANDNNYQLESALLDQCAALRKVLNLLDEDNI